MIRAFRRPSAPRREVSVYLAGLAVRRANRYVEELMAAAGDRNVTKLDLWTYADFAHDALRSAAAHLGE
jgi:hypothetical protein